VTLPATLQRRALRLIDAACAGIPRPLPPREKFQGCRLVSHRGSLDNRRVLENTLPAFDRAQAAGVWGIEFDVRWTRDLHPVVFHDADLQRLAGRQVKVRDLTLAELKLSCAWIPSLREVIARYGKRLHLMIELKQEKYPDPRYQCRLLQELLKPLVPTADFHLITLDPDLFALIEFVPRPALLPIAELNVARLSRLSLSAGYGGILGHYLLLTGPVLKRHLQNGQQVGTGFVNSESCLFRELNRGVTWIFSDNAAALQAVCKRRAAAR